MNAKILHVWMGVMFWGVLSVPAAELANDANTLLLLRFDSSTAGAAGETARASLGTGFGEGLVGQAVHTGSNGYLRYDSAGNIRSTEGTVEFWIRPDWDGNTGITHVFFTAGISFNNGMLLSIDGANNLRFLQWGDDPETAAVESGVERGFASSGDDWIAGAWYHLAATWNGATRQMAFYVNGQQVASRTNGVFISSFGGTSLSLGASAGGAQPAVASFDEVRIYDRARLPGEILDDYSAGLDLGLLSYPRGLAVDAANRVLVAESGAHRIAVFAADGAPLFKFGSNGAGPGQFNQPWDVAVDNTGRTYVCDRGNHRIQVFTNDTNFVFAFGSLGSAAGQFNDPQGLLVDAAQGLIYVADTLNHRVQRFRLDGAIDSSWGVGGVVGATGTVKRDHTGFDQPVAIAVHPLTREVYVSDSGNARLEVFDAQGAYLRTYHAVYRANGLAFDAAGNLFIAGEDPNESFTAYDGRLRLLAAGDDLISRHYTGGLDDLSRVLGDVAFRPGGQILMTDTLNGRVTATDSAFTRPVTDLNITAAGTNVVFRWRTARPASSWLRYGPIPGKWTESGTATLTTQHEVTLTGLTPNTRLFYSVAFPDSFDGSRRFTPPDILNTGCLPGETQFLRLKGAGVIYTDANKEVGYSPIDAATLEQMRQRFRTVADFYWRNSGFKLWLDIQIIEVNRDATNNFWVLDAMERDLAALGYSAADDFDGAWGTSVFTIGNFGGGGTLFGRNAARSQWVTQSDFVAIHEVNHSVDSMYQMNGLKKFEFNHGIWAIPNGLGQDTSVNGQILRNFLPVNFTAVKAPFTKIMTAPDADHDGLPDSSPPGLLNPLSITEASLGSSTATADTDGDGVSDLQEAMALPYHATHLSSSDSDGDGVLDARDLNPAYRLGDQVLKASPVIDGQITSADNWTILTDHWGYTNSNFVTDNNSYQGRVTTYAAWDDQCLYLALNGPATTTTIHLDGSGDNWFIGPDNYLLTLANGTFSRSVRINVGVPDLFRQIDDDGQWSEFFDTDAKFTRPYNGRPFYSSSTEGAGFPGRLITESELVYQRGGSGSNQVWEVAIPWSAKTAFHGQAGKKLALSMEVSGDYLFETDHAARLRLVDSLKPVRALTVSATGINKTYDGTTAAAVTLSDDRASGDVLSLAYGSASFENKSAAANKPMHVTGITVTGDDAANYTFNPTADTTASITPRALTVTATGISKTYDGTTAATVTLSDDRASGDVLMLAYGSASFESESAGANKPVHVTGITVTGDDAANYTFNPTADTTASILAPPRLQYEAGVVRITFDTVPGIRYGVFCAEDLLGPWRLLQSIVGQGPETIFVDDGSLTTLPPAQASVRFYMITVQ